MSDTPQRAWEQADHGAMARELGAARAASEQAALLRLAELLGVVFRLRDEQGCPWDRGQTLESMAAHLAEEAAETAEAVAARDDAGVAEELGDTLMNVLLMARIGSDEGRFDLAGVAGSIAEKLVRRHPHVFGPREARDATAALASWNQSKAAEGTRRASLLDGVPAQLPSLLAAAKLGSKAAGAGFDWPDAGGAMDKLREELAELEEALAVGERKALEHELGDVLFSVVNVARKTGLDPDLALRRACQRFRKRFGAVEQALGEELGSASLEHMEQLWRDAARQQAPGDDDPHEASDQKPAH